MESLKTGVLFTAEFFLYWTGFINQEGTTEFTAEFNTALNNAYTNSSFWDFISVDPLSILIRGTINHKRHEWINETTK